MGQKFQRGTKWADYFRDILQIRIHFVAKKLVFVNSWFAVMLFSRYFAKTNTIRQYLYSVGIIIRVYKYVPE